MANPTPTPVVIPTGQELFDSIMGAIEPELTSTGVKTLREKYKNENPDQQLDRRKRYELAYTRYEEAYQKTVAMLQLQVERYRRASFDEVEQDDRAREEQRLKFLSSAFS